MIGKEIGIKDIIKNVDGRIKYGTQRNKVSKEKRSIDKVLASVNGWTEEDQEKFERERNRRQCLNHRNKHREEYTSYQKAYQQRYRERNRFHYGHTQWNRLHPDNQMTLEQYVEYRKQKEEKKEKKDDI